LSKTISFLVWDTMGWIQIMTWTIDNKEQVKQFLFAGNSCSYGKRTCSKITSKLFLDLMYTSNMLAIILHGSFYIAQLHCDLKLTFSYLDSFSASAPWTRYLCWLVRICRYGYLIACLHQHAYGQLFLLVWTACYSLVFFMPKSMDFIQVWWLEYLVSVGALFSFELIFSLFLLGGHLWAERNLLVEDLPSAQFINTITSTIVLCSVFAQLFFRSLSL
jgi:hypothetical protein